MSVIFGIFYRDGRTITDELETMYSGMHQFAHERYALCSKAKNCGFGHMLTYNTPEAVNECMPKWIEEAKLMFVAEGRIDNRDELFSLLKIPLSQQASMPDGDLILSAYLKWDNKCVDKLLGKFSFAAFHEKEQRLFLARDKMDVTSIDYYENSSIIAFSSSSKGILPLPSINTEIDEEVLAYVLADCQTDSTRSCYKNIKHLLPSHLINATREKSSLVRYWNYVDIPIHRGLQLEEYAEDLYENLNKAVKARLRSYKPVASQLSGGMDSTTISYIAAKLLKEKGQRLTTYTHIPQFEPPEKSNRIGNEKHLASLLVKSSGNINPKYLDSAHISPLTGVEKEADALGELFRGGGNAFWCMDILEQAHNDGFGVLLNGAQGNAVISRNGYKKTELELKDYLFSVHWNFLKQKIIKPVIRPDPNVCFISSDFSLKHNLNQKRKKSDKYISEQIKQILKEGKHVSRLGLDVNISTPSVLAKVAYNTGIEQYDPTTDVRVLQSSFSIPPEMFFGEMNKWVFRTMMKDKLPDKIRLNTKKGKQSSDLAQRLVHNQTEMDDLLSQLEKSSFAHILNTEKLLKVWNILKKDTNNNLNSSSLIPFMRTVTVYSTYKRLSEFTNKNISFN
jgi:asparagine synthase (glutamine-hydrolysing)